MKKAIIGMAMLALAACSGQPDNPLMTDSALLFGAPEFSKYESTHYEAAFLEAFKQQRAEIDAIVANTEAATFDNTIGALERSGRLLTKVTGVFLLEDLGAPAYKIASFEVVDLDLIKYVASTGKPMIISTGMADAEEINEAVEVAKQAGCKELAVLHCVSGYPAPPEDYNLRTIPDMLDKLGVIVGLSDHTLDNTTAITSVGLGVSIIEKHFTLDRKGGGPDDAFSLEPKDLAMLCRDTKVAWLALGEVNYSRKSSEIGNVKFRRSLYFVKDLESGSVVTEDVVRSIRPGYGLPPKMKRDILGKKINQSVKAGTAVKNEYFD